MKHPILVTGGAGFIGSYVCEQLLKQGFTVITLDDLSLGSIHNLPRNRKLTFIKCDLVNPKTTALIIQKYQPQLIYHLAAWAHEGLSQFAPIKITQTNYNAFLNLIVPAINCGLKKIVICSSMSVYGSQPSPFTENMRRLPVDIYGIAKVAMENATEVLAKVYGFKYVIVRPHNVYGPRQNLGDPYRNVVAIFINRVLQNKPFYIYGDGQQKRAFTYIDDLTPYLVKVGLDTKINNDVFNLGPRREYSINALSHLVLQAFNSKIMPIYLPDRPAEVKDAFCTAGKAQKYLHFRPTTELAKGVSKMVEWAKQIGPQKMRYLQRMEINSPLLPKTWQHKLI